jgi:hypothetical protein
MPEDKGEKLQKIWDATPSYAELAVFDNRKNPDWPKEHGPGRAGFVVSWGMPGTGFGELTFVLGEDGKLILETECMSKDFVKHILNKLIDDATLES